MQLLALRQSLDRRDLMALRARRQRQARQHALAIDVDRARPARAVVAPLLRARQFQVIAQRVEQRHPRFQRHGVLLSVDLQRHLPRAGRQARGNLGRGRRDRRRATDPRRRNHHRANKSRRLLEESSPVGGDEFAVAQNWILRAAIMLRRFSHGARAPQCV